MRLAGTYHPIPFLLERLKHYLPGVTKTSALWLDHDKQLYTSNEEQPLREYLKVKAQNIRNSQSASEWFKHADLFRTDANTESQLTIDDEDALNVLRLYFTSPIDGKKDIVTITFPNNVFLKSLNIEFKGISTQEKHILSNMLSSILSAEHQKAIDERMFLMRVEEINQKQSSRIKQLTEDLKSTEQLYSSAIRNILNEFKAKLERELNKEFVFNNKVVFKLAKERLSIEEIENAVKNAIYLAYNLNLSEHKINITSDHIQLKKTQQPFVKTSSALESDHKTIALLDRYEEAANQALSKGLVANGKNIAAQLDPPVTPPAITDAVKKNNTKISYLLQQYPEKWQNARKSIKPISNLDEKIENARAI
ncbi:MAG TPA: hypothetical protein VKY37_10020 [Brumimicrobium sp.]|nr:hypothetical protein [Brumimicrobium sp.]